MRQSWLYDSDSDDDSGPEKENEKKMEQHKNNEEEMESIAKAEEEKNRKQIEEAKNLEEVHRTNDRKRKGDEGSAEKKKKSKVMFSDVFHLRRLLLFFQLICLIL